MGVLDCRGVGVGAGFGTGSRGLNLSSGGSFFGKLLEVGSKTCWMDVTELIFF